MAQNAVTWEVTGQRYDWRPGPTGALVPGHVITIRIPSGSASEVFIPDSQYSAQMARDLLYQRALTMMSIEALTG